jgi:chromate reductase
MGIAGSLRRGSYNRGLINAAQELAPSGWTIVTFPLDALPLYDADYDADHLRPPEVAQFKQAVTEADALLIATPEYNHGVPGVLKNAIDWASRPGLQSPLVGKPVAIIGAAAGAIGTARAQQELKLVLMSTLALVMPHPGVLVANAADKFDASGALVHEPTRQFLAKFLTDLEAWTKRVGQ